MKHGLPVTPDDLRRRVNANLDFPLLIRGLVSPYEEVLVAQNLSILPSAWSAISTADRAQLIGWDRVRRLVESVMADVASSQHEREARRARSRRDGQ